MARNISTSSMSRLAAENHPPTWWKPERAEMATGEGAQGMPPVWEASESELTLAPAASGCLSLVDDCGRQALTSKHGYGWGLQLMSAREDGQRCFGYNTQESHLEVIPCHLDRLMSLFYLHEPRDNESE